MLEDDREIYLEFKARNISNLKIYTQPNYQSNKR